MAISASLVNELRKRTGAGMMECKKALEATDGDLDKAIDELRKSGRAKADKKAGRIAAEGVVAALATPDNKRAVMIEVNCETDFVARDANFLNFVNALIKAALSSQTKEPSELLAVKVPGSEQTLEEARQELIVKVGENVQLRRVVFSDPAAVFVGTYVHSNRIGVMVELDTENVELAKDIAMHIAASKPLVITPDEVNADLIAREKEIYSAQAASSGKPPEIVEKMVAGRLKKYLDEVSLVGQPFVKDPDVTVGSLLTKSRAKVLAFYRIEVGEGIEKITEDFKEAVMSQAQGS